MKNWQNKLEKDTFDAAVRFRNWQAFLNQNIKDSSKYELTAVIENIIYGAESVRDVLSGARK